MAYVKNAGQLSGHGNRKTREAALEIIEYALAQSNPYGAPKEIISVQGDLLVVDGLRFDLRKQRRIFVLGAGKATYPIAKALEEILGNSISDGLVVSKYGHQKKLTYVKLYSAGHPIPDESGFEASQKMLDLAKKTQAGDIVFGCITGGSSALLPFSVKGVTLAEKKAVTHLLLTSGANIVEINAVRKHLSQIKGGG